MAQARADDVLASVRTQDGQRHPPLSAVSRAGLAATSSASFCRAISRASGSVRSASSSNTTVHSRAGLTGDPPRDQQRSPAGQRRALAGHHGLVHPPPDGRRQVTRVGEHVAAASGCRACTPGSTSASGVTWKLPPVSPVPSSGPRRSRASRSSVLRRRRPRRPCAGRATVATSQPASPASAPQASTRSSASPDALDGGPHRLGRAGEPAAQLLDEAHGVSPPTARSRSERACCSRATSCPNTFVYSSGASTGFIRCSLPLSAATRRTVAISCSRASTALT